MLAAATVYALNQYVDYFRRAARFAGTTRERMVAIGEADRLFHRRFPMHYRALQIVRVASQLGPAMHRRQAELERCECLTVGLMTDLVYEAVTLKELELDSAQRPEKTAFSIWALVFGARALMNTAPAVAQLGNVEAESLVRDSTTLLLDARGWRPLSNEWDYAATRRRIRSEVFSREWHETAAA